MGKSTGSRAIQARLVYVVAAATAVAAIGAWAVGLQRADNATVAADTTGGGLGSFATLAAPVGGATVLPSEATAEPEELDPTDSDLLDDPSVPASAAVPPTTGAPTPATTPSVTRSPQGDSDSGGSSGGGSGGGSAPPPTSPPPSGEPTDDNSEEPPEPRCTGFLGLDCLLGD